MSRVTLGALGWFFPKLLQWIQFCRVELLNSCMLCFIYDWGYNFCCFVCRRCWCQGQAHSWGPISSPASWHGSGFGVLTYHFRIWSCTVIVVYFFVLRGWEGQPMTVSAAVIKHVQKEGKNDLEWVSPPFQQWSSLLLFTLSVGSRIFWSAYGIVRFQRDLAASK